MAHQDITTSPAKDLPPAYPYNDKPPDYHDVCPRTTISPPPVDAPPPDNIPTINVLPFDNISTVNPPSGYTPTVINVSFATRHSQENVVVVTEPPTHASSSHHTDESQNQDEGIDWNTICWKVLVVLSIIAAIIAPPIGLHACIHACEAYHSDKPHVKRCSGLLAIIMCAISYVGVIVLVSVVPAILA